MKPHHQLTFVRNRHRARELRDFRGLVEAYFAGSDRDPNDVPVDWEGAQAARSRINQMLPRVLQIVRAAGIGSPLGGPSTDPGFPLARVDVLQRIFTARYADGSDQEILDVIDMALGVYEGDRYLALARTFNPLYYAGAALGFVAGAPRRLLMALGLWRRSPGPRLRPEDVARLEAVAARLGDAEELIESRLAALQDRQAMRHAEIVRQLGELAERLDFAERVLAQREPMKRLERPEGDRIVTPV